MGVVSFFLAFYRVVWGLFTGIWDYLGLYGGDFVFLAFYQGIWGLYRVK